MAEITQISEADAGAQIESLLAADPTPTPGAKPEPEGDVREVRFKAKVKAKKESAPEPEPEPEPDEEVPEEEVPAEDVDAEEEDKPAPRLMKVKVDGIEAEVPEDEVVKGYSRTADYTRKTQALAQERKEFHEREMVPVRAERQLYAERLEALHTAVQSLLPEQEPDWNAIRQNASPEEFTEAFASWQGQRQRVEKIRAEQDRIAQLQAEDAKRVREERLQQEYVKLQDALPDLKDPEKGKGLRDDLTAYILSLGFTEEGVAAVEDHRLLVMADKARRWDESQRRRPKLEEKIDRALDTIRPSSPRSAPKRSETERAKARLAETGRVEDAATLISKML